MRQVGPVAADQADFRAGALYSVFQRHNDSVIAMYQTDDLLTANGYWVMGIDTGVEDGWHATFVNVSGDPSTYDPWHTPGIPVKQELGDSVGIDRPLCTIR